MIVADSSVWIAFFNGAATRAADQLEEMLHDGQVALGDIILLEVLQGFRSDVEYRRARALLSPLPCFDMAGREIAMAAVQNYCLLRTQGFTPRGTIDVLIATFCIENGHTLLHVDRDFDAMEKHLGLKTL